MRRARPTRAWRMKNPRFVHPRVRDGGSLATPKQKARVPSLRRALLARVDRSPGLRLPRSPSRGIPSGMVERANRDSLGPLTVAGPRRIRTGFRDAPPAARQFLRHAECTSVVDRTQARFAVADFTAMETKGPVR